MAVRLTNDRQDTTHGRGSPSSSNLRRFGALVHRKVVGSNSTRGAHRVMLEREYYHLENMCNLHETPSPFHSFILSVLPVKWRGASAAPVRAVAIIGK